MQKIQKIDIALEQLEDALEAYFKGRHHSATVLAGAAEQLFAGYMLKCGLEPAWPQERAIITRIANALKEEGDVEPTTEKKIGDLMNHSYNHSKHAGKTGHEVSMDSKSEARRIIDRAITNYDQLCGQMEHDLPDLPLAQRFRLESISEVRSE
ncbi:MAG: hypothetical protein PSV26_01120 [Polaromonas sp.]|uniref:hypothetical protein n=1 Tax=Polaromonas sp. TaxID=1869339 RepID=UPI0024889C40|nr:hypothetical protein [Polaromonas sp.]MDI1236065.1 hypothetical protein [Polaromonas sp.]